MLPGTFLLLWMRGVLVVVVVVVRLYLPLE